VRLIISYLFLDYPTLGFRALVLLTLTLVMSALNFAEVVRRSSSVPHSCGLPNAGNGDRQRHSGHLLPRNSGDQKEDLMAARRQ
jgi:hypothetical protein